jgi:hypothetical protein
MEDGGRAGNQTDDLFHARELEKSQAVDELSGINRMGRQNRHNRRGLTPNLTATFHNHLSLGLSRGSDMIQSRQ